MKTRWAEYGPCKACGGEGHYWFKNGKHYASHNLKDCPTFRNFSIDQRLELAEKEECCTVCGSWTHIDAACDKVDDPNWTCQMPANGVPGTKCGKKHANIFHKDMPVQRNHVQTRGRWPEEIDPDVMLAITSANINGKTDAVIFIDNGSSSSMITHSLAAKLGLQGRVGTQTVQLCTQEPETRSVVFYLLNWNIPGLGIKQLVLAGVDRITENPGSYDVSYGYVAFPWVPPGALDKPAGEVQLLIGSEMISLHCAGGDRPEDLVGELRVYTVPFGSGYILMGHDPRINFQNPLFSEASMVWRNNAISRSFGRKSQISHYLRGAVQINGVSLIRGPKKKPLPDFLEAELLGYDVPVRCDHIYNCDHCSILEPGRTVAQHFQLQEMRAKAVFNREEKHVTIDYPIIGDPSLFKNNKHQAVQRAESLWKSLQKKGWLEHYHAEATKYINDGVWVETSEKYIKDHVEAGGHVHWISHHGVSNPGSKSTPLRLVSDSTVQNCYKGPSLNDLYGTGPPSVNSLYRVLISWRSCIKAGVYDVKRAYHTVRTTNSVNMMRLVVWKFKQTDAYKTYRNARMGMGDPPSSTGLEVVKSIAAKEGWNIDPMLAQQILDWMYVDDGLVGGEEEDMQRMRGECTVSEDGSLTYTGTIVQILGLVGFKIKMIVVSGETNPAILEKCDRVLGIRWHATEDLLSYKLAVNLSGKLGAGRVDEDLCEKDLSQLDKVKFSRRLCLQIASQNFDPLGMLTAWTVKLKSMMKVLVQAEYTWDEPVSEEHQAEWRSLVREMVLSKEIFFKRTTNHPLSTGRPELCVFWDGSNTAFAAVVYVRWRLNSAEKLYSYIVTSKSRLVPKDCPTTPRSELSGAVVATRITKQVIRAMPVKPVRVTIMGDSTCTVAACSTNAGNLKPFFSNRVIEICRILQDWGPYCVKPATEELSEQELAELPEDKAYVDKIQWLPGPENVADYPTRGIPWEELGLGSVWQDGPGYLRQDRSTWPIKTGFDRRMAIPDVEQRKKFAQQAVILNMFIAYNAVQQSKGSDKANIVISKMTDLFDKWRDYNKLRRIFARLNRAERLQDRSAIAGTLDEIDLMDAAWQMAWYSMEATDQDIKKHKSADSLGLFWRDGLARARGRFSEKALTKILGYDSLIVLSPHSKLAKALMYSAHEEDHRRSPGDLMHRCWRMGYWILRSRALAKQTVKNCMYCRKQAATAAQQIMGDRPDVIYDFPCRPFSHIALDYTGYQVVKGIVNKRARMKVFPLIMVCLNTSAIHIQCAVSASTEDFFIQWNQFVAIRGTPRFVYCDLGSQLVAAGKELKRDKIEVGDFPNLDFKQIMDRTSSTGITWKNAPSGCQFRDGKAESMVAQVKKTLRHLHNRTTLTYPELSALLSRVADLVNSRPLGLRHHGGSEPSSLCVVTPNLLLQSSRTCSATEHFHNMQNVIATYTIRLRVLEECFADWWKAWIDSVFESLVPYRKWKKKFRNLSVGDIVLIKHQGKIPPQSYRYGRILELHEDDKGAVRTVTVGVRPRHVREGLAYKPKKLDEILMAVQRLIVLLPAEEQPNLEPADEELHVCDEEVRIPDMMSPLSPRPEPTEQQEADMSPDTVDSEAGELTLTKRVYNAQRVHYREFQCSVCVKARLSDTRHIPVSEHLPQ